MLLRDLGASGDVLEATWSGLGLSWMPLGASGEALVGFLGHLGATWGVSWGLLGWSWEVLERPWGLLKDLGLPRQIWANSLVFTFEPP